MTYGGLVHWDLSTETYTRHLIQARDIAVAPDGTLWLATDHGLCHFTGPVDTADDTTCRNYTDADGLMHNAVRAVAVTDDNVVWAGTETGVSRFDGRSWKSYPSPVPTEDLAVARSGEVWHATAAGVGRYMPSQDVWTTYAEEHGLPSAHAQVIAIGPAGEVWTYVLWHGVHRFDGERWQAVDDPPGGIVADIAFAADGTPWVATVGGTHYPGGSLVYREDDAWSDVTTAHGLTSISAVALGPGGVVAAGTNLGLGIYQGGEWRLLKDGPTSDRATSVAVTPDGAAWFGFGDHSVSTLGGGLSRFNGQDWQYFLGDAEVNVLAVAPDGSLWAGVGCDVQRFDGIAWDTVARCEEDLPLGNVLDIAFTPDGAAWVANGFGLARFDGQSWTVFEGLVNSLVVAPDGAIWMNGWKGSQDSYYVARFDGENWTTYRTADSFPGRFTVGAVTSDGHLWGVVPERGLASFDGRSWTEGQSWTFYPPPDGVSLEWLTTVDPDGGLWLSTEDGVARFDPSAELTTGRESAPGEPWTIYTKDDGLVGYYSAIAFGPNDEIWFGTTRLRPASAPLVWRVAHPSFNPRPFPLCWF